MGICTNFSERSISRCTESIPRQYGKLLKRGEANKLKSGKAEKIKGGIMSEDTIVSPEICIFSDKNFENLNIQIELPGVEKKDIELQMFEDGFYIMANKEGAKFMGSYALIFPVQPEKAISEYSNGVLMVNVPYKNILQGGVRVNID
jgi:HSP20 family molecular chaperone IbpA